MNASKEKKVISELKKSIRYYEKLLIEYQNDLIELENNDSINGELEYELMEDIEEKISRIYDIKNVIYTLMNRFLRLPFEKYSKTIDTLMFTLREVKEIAEEIDNMEESKWKKFMEMKNGKS